MKFFLDESLPMALAIALRKIGFDVVHTHDAGMTAWQIKILPSMQRKIILY